MNYAEVGNMLFISERSVRRYVDLFFSTGNVDPEKQRHGSQCLLNEFEQTTVLQALIDNPSVYLIELQKKLFDTTGTWVHESTIYRTVHHFGFTRIKLQHIAYGRSEDQRAKFIADISIFDPHMFLWVDESGFRQRNSIRKYGVQF